jgi:hypothetical protein
MTYSNFPVSSVVLAELGRVHSPRLLTSTQFVVFATVPFGSPSIVPRSDTRSVSCVLLCQVSLCEPSNHHVAIWQHEKMVRWVKKSDSPLIEGYQIFHNYVRPHMALDGKTPSEVAGIKVEGEDKWVTLIQNATKAKRGTTN